MDTDRDGQVNGRPFTPQDFGVGADAPTLKTSTVIIRSVPVKPDTAEAAYKAAVANAGCFLRRASADLRLIADLTSRGKSGSTMEVPNEMGGFGETEAWPLSAP